MAPLAAVSIEPLIIVAAILLVILGGQKFPELQRSAEEFMNSPFGGKR